MVQDEDGTLDQDGNGRGPAEAALSALQNNKGIVVPAVRVAAAVAAAKGPEIVRGLSSGLQEKGEEEAKRVGQKAVEGAKDGLGSRAGSGLAGKVLSKAVGAGKESGGAKKTRRLPIQRYTDVAVPVEKAYKAWTKFEKFPKFMHRVHSVEKKGNDKLRWQEKIWFSSRQWEGKITERRKNDRIAWKTKSGTQHSGIVSFHKIDNTHARDGQRRLPPDGHDREDGVGPAVRETRRRGRSRPLQGVRRDAGCEGDRVPTRRFRSAARQRKRRKRPSPKAPTGAGRSGRSRRVPPSRWWASAPAALARSQRKPTEALMPTKPGTSRTEQNRQRSQQTDTSSNVARNAATAAAAAAATSLAGLAVRKALAQKTSPRPTAERERTEQDAENHEPRDESTAARGSDSALRTAALTAWATAAPVLLPFGEQAADSAGRYVARHAPDDVRKRIIPRFIAAFEEK